VTVGMKSNIVADLLSGRSRRSAPVALGSTAPNVVWLRLELRRVTNSDIFVFSIGIHLHDSDTNTFDMRLHMIPSATRSCLANLESWNDIDHRERV
jgi:hypothetical protein